MKIIQAQKKGSGPIEFLTPKDELKNPLVLAFGNRYLLESESLFEEIQALFPTGHIVMGSTSGEIGGSNVSENSLVLTAIEFDKSHFLVETKNMYDYKKDDFKLGQDLMDSLPQEGLKHVFVVSEGSTVNGSALIEGIEYRKDASIGLSGGLCGDDARFEKTLASYNEPAKEGEVVAIGFYGETLEISSANYGGWTPFGPQRVVTKAEGNVLFELDGKPALDLYKSYLGEKADELPESALLYPLNVAMGENEKPIVRTILNIDDNENTMILAGDVPEGSKVQLMMSTVDDIADGANRAAVLAMENRNKSPELTLMVSCVGRKLVMDQRTEEEVEEVISVVGENSAISGFYSYGELAPFEDMHKCKLHNQTMTLTLLSE